MTNTALAVPVVVWRSKRKVGFSQGMCRPWSQDMPVVVHLPRGVGCERLVVLPQSCSPPPFSFPAYFYLYLRSDAALVGSLSVLKYFEQRIDKCFITPKSIANGKNVDVGTQLAVSMAAC